MTHETHALKEAGGAHALEEAGRAAASLRGRACVLSKRHALEEAGRAAATPVSSQQMHLDALLQPRMH